jgi:hypothetical protein
MHTGFLTQLSRASPDRFHTTLLLLRQVGEGDALAQRRKALGGSSSLHLVAARHAEVTCGVRANMTALQPEEAQMVAVAAPQW